MMEEIVLLETFKSAKKNKWVFKLIFAGGEFDMAIYDSKNNTCDIIFGKDILIIYENISGKSIPFGRMGILPVV